MTFTVKSSNCVEKIEADDFQDAAIEFTKRFDEFSDYSLSQGNTVMASVIAPDGVVFNFECAMDQDVAHVSEE